MQKEKNMLRRMRRVQVLQGGLFFLWFLMAGCTSVQKTEIPVTANPTDELEKLNRDIAQAFANQLDVLAPEEISKAISYRDEAKSDITSQQSQKEILDDIGYACSYLRNAETVATTRRQGAQALLGARERAVAAGAREVTTAKTLKELDEKFRKYVPDMASVDVKDVEKLQAGYVDLESMAIQEQHLGSAKAIVAGAKKNNAEKYAPNTFRQAEIDLKAAELAVSANRNNPSSYTDAVRKAHTSADFLNATLEATRQGKVDENTAVKLARQDSKIKALRAEVANADRSISAQQAIDESRRQFAPEEAEVFQQGNRLVFRLKNIKFPPGKSDLPADSLPVLSKVSNIAEQLGPRSVVVEGHTDSVGGTKLNDQLSQDRAETVSKYLSSHGIDEAIITTKGYGFSKPLASNKTSLGRAQNRRVDIVITPESNTASE